MRATTLFGALLAILTLVLPAVAVEPTASPVAHEEIGRVLEEVTAQLHGLGTHWREHFREPRGPRPLISIMLRHRDELDLSPDQVQNLERLRSDFQRQAVRLGADLRIAEMDLANLLEADPVDLAQAEAKVREIERLAAELRLARIRAIEQGKAQLTPEQRAKLRGLLTGSRPFRPRAGRHHPTGEPEARFWSGDR